MNIISDHNFVHPRSPPSNKLLPKDFYSVRNHTNLNQPPALLVNEFEETGVIFYLILIFKITDSKKKQFRKNQSNSFKSVRTSSTITMI